MYASRHFTLAQRLQLSTRLKRFMRVLKAFSKGFFETHRLSFLK